MVYEWATIYTNRLPTIQRFELETMLSGINSIVSPYGPDEIFIFPKSSGPASPSDLVHLTQTQILLTVFP